MLKHSPLRPRIISTLRIADDINTMVTIVMLSVKRFYYSSAKQRMFFCGYSCRVARERSCLTEGSCHILTRKK